MARSETFQMPIDWPPERRPLSEWRSKLSRPNVLRRERELWQLSTILLGNRPRAAGYGIAAVVLYPAKPGAIQVCSCSRFTRLVLVRLIFLVTDRSRSHGHAP
jgi:hypothetical protein